MENRTTGLRPWKTSKTPCGRWKCTPFGTFGTTFPPEGELLAVLCIEVLMSSEAERRANFPLRGKSPQGNRGAFPSGEARLYGFPAHRYLSANESLSPRAEILRFAQNDRVRRKGKWRYSSAADRRHIYSSPVGRYHNPQPRSGCQSTLRTFGPKGPSTFPPESSEPGGRALCAPLFHQPTSSLIISIYIMQTLRIYDKISLCCFDVFK